MIFSLCFTILLKCKDKNGETVSHFKPIFFLNMYVFSTLIYLNTLDGHKYFFNQKFELFKDWNRLQIWV